MKNVLFILCLFSFAWAVAGRASGNETEDTDSKRSVFKVALRAVEETGGRLYSLDGCRFCVMSGKRFLLVSSKQTNEHGYNGPPTVAAVVNAEGTVTRVKIIKTPDSRAHAQIVKRNLAKLTGQALTDENRTVLAVTGATITAGAVSRTVENMLDEFEPVFKKLAWNGEALFCGDVPLEPRRQFRMVTP